MNYAACVKSYLEKKPFPEAQKEVFHAAGSTPWESMPSDPYKISNAQFEYGKNYIMQNWRTYSFLHLRGMINF
ncbi:MAG TPA: hypothetical protein PLA36_09965, partial [Deltaproteobacteria bacterium]|nr:hypothetical protein [Deltaproteobacteria bacterium]